MTAAKPDSGEQAATVEAIRGRSAARHAKLRAARRCGTIAVFIGLVTYGIVGFVLKQRQTPAPVRAQAAAFHREWTPRAYTWTADQPTPAQPDAQLQPPAPMTGWTLRIDPWLSVRRDRQRSNFLMGNTLPWTDAPLRVRTVRIQGLGDHPLVGLLAEQLFVLLRDDHDLQAVSLVPPGGAEPAGGLAPDVDLYVCVDRAESVHAKGRTRVDVAFRLEAIAGTPFMPVRGVEPGSGIAWKRRSRTQASGWVHTEFGVHEGLPLWRLVAAGLLPADSFLGDYGLGLEDLGLGQQTCLFAPPAPPADLLLPYEAPAELPWPDGATRTLVSSRRSVGCANDTRWTIVPTGSADAWLAALRQRFVAAGWSLDLGTDDKALLRRFDETFFCEVVPTGSAANFDLGWLPAPSAAPTALRAAYRKVLDETRVRARLAAAAAPTKAQLAWATLALEHLPLTWFQAVVKAPLADYAGAVPWPALVRVAKAQLVAGDLPAARATMGAAFVQAQLAAAFEPAQAQALERVDAAWREHAVAMGLPATPPTAATAADVAAVGGAIVPTDAVNGSEVRSRDGFLWLAARADRPGFAAFWRTAIRFDSSGPPPLDARTRFASALRRARGLSAPTIFGPDSLELVCTDFADRAPRHVRLDGEGDAPPPSGLRATVVDDERLRVRAAR